MKNKNSFAPAPGSVEGEDVTTWALPEGAIARLGRGGVRDMAFSPNGHYFAVATEIGLWLYELPTLSPIALWDTERGMTDDVSFSPDGSQIGTYTFAEDLKIWDVQSGVCITQIEVSNRHHIRHIQKFAFSQDGQRIAAISDGDDGNIYIWCPHTGRQLNEIKLGSTAEGIYPFQFSSDTNLLAGRKRESDAEPESILVWHMETGKQIGCFTEYSGEMEKLCFSPDGSYLATGSSDGILHVWGVNSGEKETTYTDYGDAQIFPHYAPEDGWIAAVVSDRKIEVWNIEQNRKLHEFERRGDSRYACFSEDGEQLAVASRSEIKIWTKGNNSGSHTVLTLHGHIPTMDTLAFSADEKTLAAGLWGDNVLLWDVASRRSYRPQGEKLPGTSHVVYRSDDGRIISLNQYGDNLKISEVGKSESVVELPPLEGGLGRAKAFSPTGHRIASADQDNNIHIWERSGTNSWEKHPTVINHSEFTDRLAYSPSGLAFSPDGKQLASISRSLDWKVCLWDVDSGEQIFELPLTPRPSRDGRYIYTYRGYDTGIAFSPCGNIIAGGKWGEITLWNAADGKTLMILPQPEESQRPITLCFSPCGEYLASGAWWQGGLQKVPIRLWEVATGKNIATFWGHTTDVQCFAFSQDGTLLISGGHDGAIYLWNLKPYL